jgi:hypothetical protein
LGGSRHFPIHGQMGQKLTDLGVPHFCRV